MPSRQVLTNLCLRSVGSFGALLVAERNNFTAQFHWGHVGHYFGLTPGSREERHTWDKARTVRMPHATRSLRKN